MARKYHSQEDSEVLDAILRRIHAMSGDELKAALSYRPKGVRATWRTKRSQGNGAPATVAEASETADVAATATAEEQSERR